MSSFTGQNIGAGKLERVKKGFWSGLILAAIVVIPFFACFYFLHETILLLFMDSKSKTALLTGVQFLHIVSPFYFIIIIKLIADGILRGAGAIAYFMITTFADLILRVVLAFFLCLSLQMGETGIWLS